MSQCSSTTDCFKASLQFKIDRATGKTSQNATKAQWQAASTAPTIAAPSVKTGDLGTNFDADG